MSTPQPPHDAVRSRGTGTRVRLGLAAASALGAAVLNTLAYQHLPMKGPFHRGFLTPDLWRDPSLWATQRAAALVLLLVLAAALAVRHRTGAAWRILSWVVLGCALAVLVPAWADWWYATGHPHPFR